MVPVLHAGGHRFEPSTVPLVSLVTWAACWRMMMSVRPDLPTGTITFLFTDVEGSTRLLHELGAEVYTEALGQHRRVIRDACASESGVEVDTQGDAFFFAFPTAPGALAAAGAMTEALAPGPISVRIGLHTGTPLLTDEGYVGPSAAFKSSEPASSSIASPSDPGSATIPRSTRSSGESR